MVAMGQQMVGHFQGVIILAKSRSHVEVAPSYIDKLFLFHDPDAPCMECTYIYPKNGPNIPYMEHLGDRFQADLMIVGRDRQHQPVQTWFPAISSTFCSQTLGMKKESKIILISSISHVSFIHFQ
jgi:hypothetical protein